MVKIFLQVRIYLKIFIFSFLFLPVATIASSPCLYKADHIDLSNKAVLCMHQDDNGYMWFGTYDGLNLYNSKHVFVYRFDLQINKSLCSNIIHKITAAEDGYLWISTFLGLNKFSITNREVSESYPECPEAKLLACNEDGNTCVIINDESILYYTPKTKTFQNIQLKGIFKDDIKALFAGTKNTFHLLMSDGKWVLISFNSDLKKTRIEVKYAPAHNKAIESAFYEKDNLYWIDSTRLLYRYNIHENKTIFIKDISDNLKRYGDLSHITSFLNDIYLAFKSNGVIKLSRSNLYQAEEVNLEIGVFSLLRDNKQDILWIGTDGQGVQMYYDKPDQFQSITLNRLPFNLQKPIRSIYTDEQSLWMGTKGDGLIRILGYDNLNNKVINRSQIRSFTTKEGLSENRVFALQKSMYHDILWIGTEGPGLSYYSYKKEKVITPSGIENLKIKKVHSICETNDSTLWVATAGNGIQKITFQANDKSVSIKAVKIFTFENKGRACNEFHAIRYIGHSNLLIGSRGGYGLIRFNIDTNEYSFIPMNSVEYSAIGDVLSLCQSEGFNFYIGASSGLTKMKILPDSAILIRQFGRRDGLENEMIHGILEDAEGNMWLSTNKGLTKYNPDNDFFHNYGQDLDVTEFSDDAFWKSSKTGRLFFGGVNGLVWINPQKKFLSDYKAELLFFDLKFAGESVHWSDFFDNEHKLLKIPPEIKSFSISFVAVDNYNIDNYEYSYKLEGLNQGWIKLQKDNEVTFSNLPPGEYTLNVKYNNDVFNSGNNNYSLLICILPPWYSTTGMVIAYIITFLVILTLSLIRVRKNIQEKQLAITKKLEKEQREKLLETKLNFFTNITHELCTPLTLINGINEQISKQSHGNEILKQYTSVLHNNVTSLNELIQEILDFRKIEDSEFGMCQIEKVSITELLSLISEMFQPEAAENNVSFRLYLPQVLIWNTDSAFLKKIITNLISNAFKYTNSGGVIKLSAQIEEDNLKIIVFNTGIGIEETDIPYIFDRFRTLNNTAKTGYIQKTSQNGLGLSICKSLVKSLKGTITVKSEPGNYAEFIVTLPSQNTLVNQRNIPDVVNHLTITDSEIKENLSSKPIILVVDDNQDIIWLITQTLSSNYLVRASCSVEEAFNIIKTETPALVITDIIMPGKTGLELTKHIKSDKYTRHIPVIIVSAKITHAEQAEGFETGADAYLPKPFSPQLLLSVINRLLENKHKMKNYYNSSESAYELSDGKLIHYDDKKFIEKVLAVIDADMENESLRPEYLAEKLGMNVRSFYRNFKKTSSLSPSDFIKDYRLGYSARLLRTSKLTVQEIIYKTGISNKSYFYREFMKKYGVTPKAYRQETE